MSSSTSSSSSSLDSSALSNEDDLSSSSSSLNDNDNDDDDSMNDNDNDSSSSSSMREKDDEVVMEDDDNDEPQEPSQSSNNHTNNSNHHEPQPDFLPDERVLCCDDTTTNTYYPAIVQQVQFMTATHCFEYFVHYPGWNARWDQWVPSHALVEDTPHHRAKYLSSSHNNKKNKNKNKVKPKQQATTTKQKKRKSTTATTTTSSSSSAAPSSLTATQSSTTSRKRRSIGSSTTPEPQPQHYYDPTRLAQYYQAYCELPTTLKLILVEECELLTRTNSRKVHALPTPGVTVAQVLHHYQRQHPTTTEFCEGLQQLLESALPVCLLYPQEQPQYQHLLETQQTQKSSLAQVYGCEYLLRLLVRLPYLLAAQSSQSQPSIFDNNHHPETIGPLLANLIVLLQTNRQACFKSSTSYRAPEFPHEWLGYELQQKQRQQEQQDATMN